MTSSSHPTSGKGDLTKGDIRGHLVRLTVPMIWGLMALISFQLVNTFYVSMLGTEALAAMTFTFPVTYAIFSLILGMSIATSSVISRQIGKGNPARVRRLTTHALLLAVLIGLVLAVGGLLLLDPVFRAMGVSADLMPLVHDYMVIWFLGSVFVNTPMIGNAALRAAGDTKWPAVVMTSAAILNAILDPILIFGLLGAPRLEIQGAAISTVLANALSMLVGYIIIRRRNMLTRSKRHLRLFGDSAKRFLYIAIPAGITSVIQPVTNAVLIALLAGFGHEAVAAFGIATRVEAFAYIIIMALAIGMAPVIGQNWGAGRYERVRETMSGALYFAVCWSVLVAVVLLAFGKPIAHLFTKEDAVIHSTVFYFALIPVTAIIGNLVAGWGSAFNAMGMPQRSFVMIFVRLVVINIPLAVIGAKIWGVAGVFGSIAITNVLAGAGFHLHSRNFLRAQGQDPATAPAPSR